MELPDSQAERERVRQYLLNQLASGGRGLFFRESADSAEGMYVFEYAGCDPGREHCEGGVVGAWLIDADGVRAVDATPNAVPRERRGMWYRFSRVHFHIAPAADWVVLASLAGPRAGSGGPYGVVPEGDGFQLAPEGTHWRA